MCIVQLLALYVATDGYKLQQAYPHSGLVAASMHDLGQQARLRLHKQHNE